jgi:hypothetical protein
MVSGEFPRSLKVGDKFQDVLFFYGERFMKFQEALKLLPVKGNGLRGKTFKF